MKGKEGLRGEKRRRERGKEEKRRVEGRGEGKD